MKELTPIQKVVNHYFYTKGFIEEEIKKFSKSEYKGTEKYINYSRHVRPAKKLLELCDGVEGAKKMIDKLVQYQEDRGLEYKLTTAIKKWPELQLK